MILRFKHWVLMVALFLTQACTVMVRDDMVVSPATEMNQTNLNALIDEAGYRPVQIPSEASVLYGLERRPADARATLVVLHGNALNLSIQPWYGLLEALAETEFNVLAIDYRGFGLSTGTASFSNMRDDARVALQSVSDDQPVFLYGLSLGSVVAAELADDPKVQGMILEGGITDTDDMISTFQSRRLFGSLFNVDVEDSLQFDAVTELEQLDKPVLVIHGKRDENIPFEYGQALYAATRHPGSDFYPVEEGGHCDTFHVESERFLTRLTGFVATNLDGTRTANR